MEDVLGVVVVVSLAVVVGGVLALVLALVELVEAGSPVGAPSLQAAKTHTAAATVLTFAKVFPMDGD